MRYADLTTKERARQRLPTAPLESIRATCEALYRRREELRIELGRINDAIEVVLGMYVQNPRVVPRGAQEKDAT